MPSLLTPLRFGCIKASPVCLGTFLSACCSGREAQLLFGRSHAQPAACHAGALQASFHLTFYAGALDSQLHCDQCAPTRLL